MKKLKEYNLVNTIYDVVDKKIPFLGICLGLQLLFESSEETPGVAGLEFYRERLLNSLKHRALKFHILAGIP